MVLENKKGVCGMNRFIKKIIVGTVATSVFFSSFSVGWAVDFGKAFLIHEDTSTEKITSSVTYEHIRRFTSEGWININVVRADLTDKYTDVIPLFSKNGLSSRGKISQMVKDSQAVAGVNGDFFATYHRSSPLGTMISNGDMLASPMSNVQDLPVLSISENKFANIDIWQWNMEVITQNGTPITVYSLNKDAKVYGEVRMFNKYWGEKTLGNTFFNDMAEVIIEDGIVTDIRVGQEPTDMPEDGFVLVGRDNAKDLLLNSFNIGDEAMLNITTSPNFEEISAAIGGGSLLVKNGQMTEFAINIKGNHPRTAAGITQNKDTLIMVTVDGRHKSFKGVSQETMAQIMIDLGAYDAINLDGGGSTTMAIAPKDKDEPIVVNHPSDGNQRSVINGLGVYSSAPQRDLDYIEIITEDKNVFPDTSREFFIKGYDKYNNPVAVDIEDVDFDIDGIEGEFNENILIPEESGEATVTARYKGEKNELDITVLNPVNEIIIEEDQIHLDTDSEVDLSKIFDDIHGINNDGFMSKISPRDIKWEISGDIGDIEDGILYTNKEASSGALTAYIGQGVKNVLVSVGYKEFSLEGFEDISKLDFSSYPDTVTGKITLDREDKQGSSSAKLMYDFTTTDDTRAAYLNFGEQGMPINSVPDKLGMWVYGNNSNHWVRGKIKDNKNKAYNIDFAQRVDWEGWKWVTANIPSNISGPITLDKIYVVETSPINKDIGHILFDDLKALYHTEFDMMVLPEETSIKDQKNRHVELEEGGLKFTIFNHINNTDNLLKHQINNKISEILNDDKVAFTFSPLNDILLEDKNTNIVPITNGSKAFSHGDSVFMQLDDSNGGIRNTDAQQWLWLKNYLYNSNEKNVVILMPEPIFGSNGFSDDLEADLFHRVLKDFLNFDKEIWVIYGGNKTKVNLKDGIRYMEIDKGSLGNDLNIDNISYMEFTINGEEITYEILPLFPEKESK